MYFFRDFFVCFVVSVSSVRDTADGQEVLSGRAKRISFPHSLFPNETKLTLCFYYYFVTKHLPHTSHISCCSIICTGHPSLHFMLHLHSVHVSLGVINYLLHLIRLHRRDDISIYDSSRPLAVFGEILDWISRVLFSTEWGPFFKQKFVELQSPTSIENGI